MRILLECLDAVFKMDRPPMSEGRFKALCGLIAGGLYVALVGIVAALCGLVGVVVVGIITLFVVALIFGLR